MARGWESKSVESQMDAAEQGPGSPNSPLSEEQKSTQREREILLLARANLMRQIEATSNERHVAALRQALNDLDNKIAKLA